jgi:hypothetical protein
VNTYRAFGLGIHSQIDLPELQADPRAPADIRIELGDVDRAIERLMQGGRRIIPTAEAYRADWDEVGVALVREGREILVCPRAGVAESLLRLYVLGPGLAAALFQRGRLVLHGNAVAVRGRAIVILGASGWGKSTSAAALHVAGHPILADDVVAIAFESAAPALDAGFPQLRIWPDAAEFLGISHGELPRVRAEIDKRAFRAERGFALGRWPLHRIYVLEHGPRPEIARLNGQTAFEHVVRHTYVRMQKDPDAVADLFARTVRLLDTVPVCSLRRPRTLEAIPEVVRIVEQDQDDDRPEEGSGP